MNIVLSCGDVNGVGLEVFVKALASSALVEEARGVSLQLIVHPQTLEEYCNKAKLAARIYGSTMQVGNTSVEILPCDHHSPVHFGREELSSARLALESLERSVMLLREARADAVLSLPVSKHSLQMAGFEFPGQTEFFAARSSHLQNAKALMILMHENLRVALVTVHVPLQSVASLLSVQVVCDRTRALHRSLVRDFALEHPRIAVLGLNPHAGEQGHIGREEVEIVGPSCDLLRAEGLGVEGPFPADGFFAHGAYKEYDGVLAMYHDQGLIPLKLIASGAGVNFSANLDIVRCSPDHGTAYDIAGKNCADERSTAQALMSIIRIVENRRKNVIT